MHEFLAGMIVGGAIGVFVVARCMAAAGRERDDG
jgi:hypothetical protein